MKKKLYFYIWVSPEFDRNVAVEVHRMCLKQYVDRFDELNFIVSIGNDFSLDGDVAKAIAFIKDVCGDRDYNLFVVKNDEGFCECAAFQQFILPLIAKEDDSMVFFGHVQGASDVNMPFRNKYSVLRWVISM